KKMKIFIYCLSLFTLFSITPVFGQSDVIINELMPRNTYGIIDEDGDASNWIEIFNSGSNAVNLSGFALHCNSVDATKWIFPDISINANDYLVVFISGKAQAEPLIWQTIIDRGDYWRFFVGRSEPPIDWISESFNDSSWFNGASGFGYGDGDDYTYIANTMSIFVRKSFQITDKDSLASMALHVDYDDAFVAYINGVEVARANIGQPGVRPGFDQPADNSQHEAEIFRGGKAPLFLIPQWRDIIKNGDNILAVEVHNAGINSSDLTLIPFLSVAHRNNHSSENISEFIAQLPTGMHTNFIADENQDTFYLSDQNGNVVDSLHYNAVPNNISIGRISGNNEQVFWFEQPTPGYKNATEGRIPFEFTDSNLPIVIINTNGKTIPDEPKITAQMGIIYNGKGKRNGIDDPFNIYDGAIGIEVRGSSSQIFPKKQYAIETRDSQGENLNVSLLGMPKENDWILYAPYSDKSMMRNVLEYTLSNNIGRYASRTRTCEVMLNGDYKGVYVLMEKVKRDKNRVNIAKLEANPSGPDGLSGGYIIKLDKPTGESYGGWRSKYPSHVPENQRLFIQYHYPSPSDITYEQGEFIRKHFDAFEKVLYDANFKDEQLEYKKYIDIDSFVDHLILVEISKNVDAYRLSSYLYKENDSDGGLICAGPVWDYNLAFGNADYDNGQYYTGWQLNWPWKGNYTQLPFWWDRLLQYDDFTSRLKNRWLTLRENQLSWPAIEGIIDSLQTEMAEAQERNYKRWPIIGKYVWPNYRVFQSWEWEILYLKNWIQERLKWLDANMPGVITAVQLNTIRNIPTNFSLAQNYPNPFNPTTTIKYAIQHNSHVILKVYNLVGQVVAVLVNEYKNAGFYQINFDASSLSSGVYLYQLQAGQFMYSKKMVLAR
ncbi:MAG: T9SS C-terminal target domain-containing protein, partial [Calditrichaeota bacterium]